MKREPMTDDEFGSAVKTRIDDAILFVEEEVGTKNEEAIRYKRGDISKDLPNIPGRSRVVSRDLRDIGQQLMPSILRVFFSRRKAVEYAPVGPEDEAFAEQATDYANYITTHDNNGFRIFHDVFSDALYLPGGGVCKVYWHECERKEAQRFSGVPAEAFMVFQAEAAEDDDIEIVDVEQDDETGMYSFSVELEVEESGIKIEAIPPEEFVVCRSAKDAVRPALIGHRTQMTVSDLVAMGYDYDEMLMLATDDEDPDWNGIEQARTRSADPFDSEDGYSDPSMRYVEYGEYYILIDADGDGIAEMRKVCTGGSSHKVLSQEVVDDHPFAHFLIEPEPHAFYGQSLYDVLKDIQLIRSQLLRLALDGTSAVVTPRMGYVEGQVSLAHLKDARPGGLVPMKTQGAIFPLPTDKAAPALALEGFRMMGEIRQDRTGQNQASMGLTPDALQSVSRIAANELVQRAQGQVEMICRFLADGMRRVYSLMLKLMTRHQDAERLIRLRNDWVPVDPLNFNPSMDVHINVGLGLGNVEERGVFLREFLGIQQQVMSQAGPDNPWFDVEKVRNALEDVAELSGNLPDRYVMTSQEWQQKQQQKAQQPPPEPKPDPAEALAQAQIRIEQMKTQAQIQNQREKTQADIQAKAAQMKQDAMSTRLNDDLQRDKLDADIVFKAAELGIPAEATLAFIRQQRALTPSGGM